MRNNEYITIISEEKVERKAGRGSSRVPFMKRIIEDIEKYHLRSIESNYDG